MITLIVKKFVMKYRSKPFHEFKFLKDYTIYVNK